MAEILGPKQSSDTDYSKVKFKIVLTILNFTLE